VCAVELNVSVDSIKYVERCSELLLWRIYVVGKKEYVRRSSRNVQGAVTKQKNVTLLMAPSDVKFWLNRL
jgi:hypothetical protein